MGELPADPVVHGGEPQSATVVLAPGVPPLPPPPTEKLKDAMDALLYLGPRDSLVAVNAPTAELVGTPYAKEIERRLTLMGFSAGPIRLGQWGDERMQYPRPQLGRASLTVRAMAWIRATRYRLTPQWLLPAPPTNIGAPLPPRPPSQ